MGEVTAELPALSPEAPRVLDRGLRPSDRVFHGGSRVIGTLVLVITGSIGLFLFLQLVPSLHTYGLHFFTQVNWNPGIRQVGVAAALVGTILVATIAVCVSVPLALFTALY